MFDCRARTRQERPNGSREQAREHWRFGGVFCDHPVVLRMVWLFVLSLFSTLRRRLRHGPLRPTWSFRFEVLVGLVRRDWHKLRYWPEPKVRAHLDRLPQPRSVLRRVSRTNVDIDGLPAVWTETKDAVEPALPTADSADSANSADGGKPHGARALLYVHGGSFLYGSNRTHAGLMANLAVHTRTRVLGIDYRLAPEHPYPAALDDATRAYEWLIDQGTPPERIVVAGDSAGGNLAIALSIRLRERQRPMPAALVLMSPWVDLTCQRPSMERNRDYDTGESEMLTDMAKRFAGDVPVDDPRLSVLDAELHDLPPMLVQLGGAELLEDECRDLVTRVRASGGTAALDVLIDMPHLGQVYAEYAPEGARALERAGRFIDEVWQRESERAPPSAGLG